MTWLSIDWQGFGSTEPPETGFDYAARMLRRLAAAIDATITVTEESRSPRHHRAKFTANPPEAK